MPTVVPFETLTDLFLNLSHKYSGTDKKPFYYKPSPDKSYEPILWDQVTDDVYSIATYLMERGIAKGDRVAILSENRYEWVAVDLAIQLVGAINVSLYTTLPAHQCEYILKDSGAKIFFVSTGLQLKKAVEVFEDCKELEQVVAFDEPTLKHLLENDFVQM